MFKLFHNYLLTSKNKSILLLNKKKNLLSYSNILLTSFYSNNSYNNNNNNNSYNNNSYNNNQNSYNNTYQNNKNNLRYNNNNNNNQSNNYYNNNNRNNNNYNNNNNNNYNKNNYNNNNYNNNTNIINHNNNRNNNQNNNNQTFSVKDQVVLSSNIDVNDNYSNEYFDYKVDFKVDNSSDIQLAPEGSFIELSDAEFERYLPEFANTELGKYFKLTKRNAFMVRDSTKLVCRILDNFAYKVKHGVESSPLKEGYRFPVQIPFWTDATKDWDNSKLQVFSYGTQDLARSRHATKGNMKVVRGPGSFVEDTLEEIRAKNKGQIPDKIMLTGTKGTGKSATLAHAVYHARSHGWIAIYLPNGHDHVNGGPFIEPASDVTGISDLFDNTMLSAAALRDLWKSHRRELRQITPKVELRKNKYQPVIDHFRAEYYKDLDAEGGSQANFTGLRSVVLGSEDTFEDEDFYDSPIINNLETFDIKTFEIKTLEDICIAGIAFRDYAGAAFVDILEELRSLDDPNTPILIAVDQVNFWDMKSIYKYEDKEIKTSQLCVPYVTKFLSNKKSENIESKSLGKNVFCIGAPTYFYRYPKKDLVTYHNYGSSLPLSITVPCYSHVEFLGVCKYYRDIGLISSSMSNQQLLAYRSHVSNTPERARKDATGFFMPIYSREATNIFSEYVAGTHNDSQLNFGEDHKTENYDSRYHLHTLERALIQNDPELTPINEDSSDDSAASSSDYDLGLDSESESESDNSKRQKTSIRFSDDSESENEDLTAAIEKIRQKYHINENEPNYDVDLSKLSPQDTFGYLRKIAEDEKEPEELNYDQYPLKERAPPVEIKLTGRERVKKNSK